MKFLIVQTREISKEFDILYKEAGGNKKNGKNNFKSDNLVMLQVRH